MALRKPKYKVTIDPEYSEGEDLGWAKTAFTSKPAIMQKGFAFSAQREEKLSFADKLKYRITAPAMIPMEIYRNQDNEEFYVEFSEQEIEKIHAKYMKRLNNKMNMFNLEHDNNQEVPAYLLEVWIVDNPTEDKAFSTFGLKVPKGTLMVTAQITDKDYYNQLVENEQTGFSIEGFLGLSLNELEAKQNKKQELSMSKVNQLNLSIDGLPSAYIGLPVGKTVIGGTEYTVEERIENEGEDNEYRCNVIVSMVPVGSSTDETSTEVTAKETKMAEDEVKTSGDTTEEVAMADESADKVSGDTKEEKVEAAEEVVDETVTETTGETYSKEEVDAKFEEVYKMIGELKASLTNEEVVDETKTEEVAMSIHDRISRFSKFSSKK